MAFPGVVRVVDDVPEAFTNLVGASTFGSIALSGGDLARRCYERLATDGRTDWSQVDVFFGDDRFVPPDHPDSNEGMARRALLDAVRPRAVHPMFRTGAIEDAADAYEALVRTAGPIDFVHLGLGTDAHTASLFPGSDALDEQRRMVVAVSDPAHPHPRLTFTFPAIARSHVVVVTVAGAEKRAAVDRIRAGEDLPGARIRADQVVWLVGHDAYGPDT